MKDTYVIKVSNEDDRAAKWHCNDFFNTYSEQLQIIE